MTLMLLRFPLLIGLSLLCALLCGFCGAKGKLWLYLSACAGLTGLILAGLAALLPYSEIVLLLLPSLFAALWAGKKGGEP